jgi:hypothetical protein
MGLRKDFEMTRRRYCCVRFKESVKEGYIIKADTGDETEWYFKEWLHIYYCPYCGANVKGRGWGQFKDDPKKGVAGGQVGARQGPGRGHGDVLKKVN